MNQEEPKLSDGRTNGDQQMAGIIRRWRTERDGLERQWFYRGKRDARARALLATWAQMSDWNNMAAMALASEGGSIDIVELPEDVLDEVCELESAPGFDFDSYKRGWLNGIDDFMKEVRKRL